VLSRAEDAYNVRGKLADYSLRLDHPRGGEKALGFAQVLAITSSDLEYLADALLSGVRTIPVSAIRIDAQWVHYQVVVPIRGLADRADRVANVLTAWELRWEGDAPRLNTVYITTTVV
jgi:hypothetical protein